MLEDLAELVSTTQESAQKLQEIIGSLDDCAHQIQLAEIVKDMCIKITLLTAHVTQGIAIKQAFEVTLSQSVMVKRMLLNEKRRTESLYLSLNEVIAAQLTSNVDLIATKAKLKSTERQLHKANEKVKNIDKELQILTEKEARRVAHREASSMSHHKERDDHRISLVGRKIKKAFKGHGSYIGEIRFYKHPYFNIYYPKDGDEEELTEQEVLALLIAKDIPRNETDGEPAIEISRKRYKSERQEQLSSSGCFDNDSNTQAISNSAKSVSVTVAALETACVNKETQGDDYKRVYHRKPMVKSFAKQCSKTEVIGLSAQPGSRAVSQAEAVTESTSSTSSSTTTTANDAAAQCETGGEGGGLPCDSGSAAAAPLLLELPHDSTASPQPTMPAVIDSTVLSTQGDSTMVECNVETALASPSAESQSQMTECPSPSCPDVTVVMINTDAQHEEDEMLIRDSEHKMLISESDDNNALDNSSSTDTREHDNNNNYDNNSGDNANDHENCENIINPSTIIITIDDNDSDSNKLEHSLVENSPQTERKSPKSYVYWTVG